MAEAAAPADAAGERPDPRAGALFVTVLVIATCGLVYELVVGTVASYLLGDSVTQFSTVIGTYLFAMGIGSYLSRFVERGVAQRFVEIELAVALVGGASAPLLFLTFAMTDAFRVVLYGSVLVVGTLVGLEIPLLLRLLKDSLRFKDLVSQVLTFDYLGALAASLLFPLLLVPRLGLVRTSLLFGLLNAGVGLWSTWLLAPVLAHPWRLRARAILLCAALAVALALGDRLTTLLEAQVYADEVVYTESSPYQRIVVTRGAKGAALFLNGHLQFTTADEYRYHEALVHPAFVRAAGHARVLILGGGDGLAAREVLRWPGVRGVTLVDLDPAMTRLGERWGELTRLNGGALTDPRVRVVNADALQWLREGDDLFDVVIVDFPDPNSFALGKLYTTGFYTLLKRRLAPEGVAVVQSTSPFFARRSFWCVDATLRAVGLRTRPYHALVPSFGEWGYVLAGRADLPRRHPLPPGLRFLSEEGLDALEVFPPDMGPLDADVNRLNNQVLVRYYEEEWSRWN